MYRQLYNIYTTYIYLCIHTQFIYKIYVTYILCVYEKEKYPVGSVSMVNSE
jgi:hypothetical protein